jgi:heme/copper-type cytochrome/quinol oxidase subunit 2
MGYINHRTGEVIALSLTAVVVVCLLVMITTMAFEYRRRKRVQQAKDVDEKDEEGTDGELKGTGRKAGQKEVLEV